MVSSKITPVFSLIAFAFIHSLTASLPFKRLVMRVAGPGAEKLYLPAYSLLTVLTISPLIYHLYKNPGRVLYKIPSPWRWIMVGGQFIAGILAPMAFRDAPHRFKVGLQLSGPQALSGNSLKIRGIYRGG